MQKAPLILFYALVLTGTASFGFTAILQEDITEDTVWDISGSPYVVYGNLYISNGATLRIEDGVTVRFDKVDHDGGRWDGAELIVIHGSLIAEGTPGWPIVFTSNEQIPFPGDWGAIVVEGDNPVILENCRIEYAKEGLLLWNMTVSSSMSSSVTGLEITNCAVHGIGIVGGTPPDIFNCTIVGNGSGLPYQGGINLMDCAATINQNNLFDNYPYDLVNDSIYNIDATQNWWDSVDEREIAVKIFDFHDRSVLGEVDFIPFLTEPAGDGGGVAWQTWGMIKSTYENY